MIFRVDRHTSAGTAGVDRVVALKKSWQHVRLLCIRLAGPCKAAFQDASDDVSQGAGPDLG